MKEELPERHLECSECKKPIHVCYTEIIGHMTYKLGMCADCPILRQRLQGTASLSAEKRAAYAGLSCGGCGLTADDVRMGSPLGCSLCYEVFEDLLLQELHAAHKIPPKVAGAKGGMPLHLGRQPGQTTELTPAMKLLALHQALHETLSREDYEQAAFLRDQIKELTDKEEGKEEGKEESRKRKK